MSLQYAAGTRVNTTFTNTNASDLGRREILFNLASALITAGWTVISGDNPPTIDTTAVVLESVATPSANLKMRVNIESTSGSCCRVRAQRTTDGLQGTGTNSGIFLLPANPKTWRIIANRHQCFIFETSGNNSRSVAYFGTPWIPSWQHGVITQCYFSYGNGLSDTSTTAANSFRVNLRGSYQNAHGNHYCNWNNNILDHSNSINNTAGSGLGLMMFHGSSLQQANEICKDWADGTEFFIDPLLKWPDTTTSGQKARVKGQLWDAAIVSGSYATEQTFTDGNGITWYVFTHISPVDNTTFGPGTLLLRVP